MLFLSGLERRDRLRPTTFGKRAAYHAQIVRRASSRKCYGRFEAYRHTKMAGQKAGRPFPCVRYRVLGARVSRRYITTRKLIGLQSLRCRTSLVVGALSTHHISDLQSQQPQSG